MGVVEEIGDKVTTKVNKGDRIAGFVHGGNSVCLLSLLPIPGFARERLKAWALPDLGIGRLRRRRFRRVPGCKGRFMAASALINDR